MKTCIGRCGTEAVLGREELRDEDYIPVRREIAGVEGSREADDVLCVLHRSQEILEGIVSGSLECEAERLIEAERH